MIRMAGIWVMTIFGIWFCGCAHVGTERKDQVVKSLARYMPLAVGNRWTYSTTFQGQPQPDLTVNIVKAEGGFFIDDRPQPSRYSIDSEGLRDGNRRYMLKMPLVEGSEWMCVADINTVERYRIVDVHRKVRVPAGVFSECVVVQMDIRMTDTRVIRNEVTYAPGVGIVEIRVLLKEGARSIPQSRLVLKSHQVKK